jgi:UDP-N-acetylglucosamine 4,6-dehydratase
MFKNQTILITGGTGSFGKKFVERILRDHPDVKKLIVFSRDELKQYEMSLLFPVSKYPQMRFFLGDVRDAQRMQRACENVDIIIHAAALKQVPAAEYNPMECIRTNILGAENVINAALDCGVKKVVALSSDKAAAPINLYGATKLCSDKLFIAANNITGDRELKFSVVRYGNVLGSRGSVVPYFLNQRSNGTLPITHPDMTRFNITLDEGVDLVLTALQTMWGSEIYVPKIPSYKILDVAKAVSPTSKTEIVGIRPGEKIHEEMITETDSINTLDCGKYYVILPTHPKWSIEKFKKEFSSHAVTPGFKYNSGENTDWLSVEDIRVLIAKHVDAAFQV